MRRKSMFHSVVSAECYPLVDSPVKKKKPWQRKLVSACVENANIPFVLFSAAVERPVEVNQWGLSALNPSCYQLIHIRLIRKCKRTFVVFRQYPHEPLCLSYSCFVTETLRFGTCWSPVQTAWSSETSVCRDTSRMKSTTKVRDTLGKIKADLTVAHQTV